jgi:hypothetical protein
MGQCETQNVEIKFERLFRKGVANSTRKEFFRVIMDVYDVSHQNLRRLLGGI